jgi:hypothetical protein
MLAFLAALVVSQASGNSYVWVDANGSVIAPLIGEPYPVCGPGPCTSPIHLYFDVNQQAKWQFNVDTAQIIDTTPLFYVWFPYAYCSGQPYIQRIPTGSVPVRRSDTPGYWTHARGVATVPIVGWSRIQPDGTCCQCYHPGGGPDCDAIHIQLCFDRWFSGDDSVSMHISAAVATDALMSTDGPPSLNATPPLHLERR